MNIIVFGTGNGYNNIRHLISNNVKIICFLDNDIDKQGKNKDGIIINSPEKIKKLNYDYIIIASQHDDEIEKQLLSFNIDSRRIIKYYKLSMEELGIYINLDLFKFNYIEYWENRYCNNGTSGSGSYGLLAEFKAEVINNFLKENTIDTVIEFGCGDGNQLKLIKYKNYIGLDISKKAISICKNIFKEDTKKEFLLYDPKNVLNIRKSDLVVCLDVLYHIIDEKNFIKTLDDIFQHSNNYVIIYTYLEDNLQNNNPLSHEKYRDIFNYLKRYDKFTIVNIIKQRYPQLSFSHFIILKRVDK